MTVPQRILHVFPYDPRHLGLDFARWAESQLERWPLAAIARSRLAARSGVHVIGPRARRIEAPPLEIVEHRAVVSGPRYRYWGDDWSIGLELALRRLGRSDICVIHLNDYAAARLTQRAARRCRVVIVLHGRGLGRADRHLTEADRVVVLREDAAEELRDRGVVPERLVVMPPSIDTERFRPPAGGRDDGAPRLGFIGRLEASKGVMEVPAVLAHLASVGVGARAELVGPATPGQRAALTQAASAAGVGNRIELAGDLPAAVLARRMDAWSVLLLPSHTEGHSLVALEACASRLPVAAVAGVLPAELERRPCISVAPRGEYPELVAELLADARCPPPAHWVLSHERAAARWDALLTGLPAAADARDLPPVSRLRRARRLRPAQRLARALLRRRHPAP